MSTPPKDLETSEVQPVQQPLDDESAVDKHPDLSPPATPAAKPELESSSPAVLKTSHEDPDTSSELSAAPSPLTTHRPTSSKTSIDDQPLTPLDSPEKSSQSAKDPPESIKETPKQPEQPQGPQQGAEEKVEEQTTKQELLTPTEKQQESPKRALPENKLAAILELNAELLNVYNKFHSQGQVTSHASELQEYSHRIQANVQWLMQYNESLSSQFPSATRIPLQVLTAPPSVPFISIEHIKALYAHLTSLFEKENARELRKRQFRQMMASGPMPMSGISAPTPITVNANGKRERPEDMAGDGDGQPSEESDGHSPRKRVDTGESKSTGNVNMNGMSVTNTPSPVSMHASPSRVNASPTHANALATPNPAPGAPGAPLRPSSSQSNSSSHAGVGAMPPSSNPGMTNPQQLERMRMIQNQNRMRAVNGGNSAGSNGSMMMAGGPPQNPQQPPSSQPGSNQIQNPQNSNPNSNPNMGHTNGNGGPPFGISPRPVPPAILPQLLTMIRNPQAHQSVQLLHSKLPDFRNMTAENQAGVLWAFQQNQMRQQAEMQHRQQQIHNLQMQAQAQAQGAGMPGQQMNPMSGQMQPIQQGQQQMQNGYPNAAMGMGMGMGGMGGGSGMRPTSAGGSMQPPPNPHSMQQQRQLNLMQQQQAALGRGPPPGMPMGAGYPGGMGIGGMNMNMNMGMNVNMGASVGMGMGMGGHARMPSNPTMGPPPVPVSAAPQPGYPQANQYPPTGGGVNPMNLGYPMQPQQHNRMHHASPPMTMAGSPPNSTPGTAWSSMSSTGSSAGQPITPAAVMQQQQARMSMSPAAASTPGGHGVGTPGGPGGDAGIDPNSFVDWQDLTAG